VTEDSVPLESIGPALQGVIPSPFATCAADGQPNITYMSIVQYVDSDTVALSRQFFNKTRANLDENPRGQVIVVDPVLGQDYQLDLRYLRTETEGPIFEAMRANLEAVSAAQGMEKTFRLRGVDIHRVERCVMASGVERAAGPVRHRERDSLRRLDEFVRRMSGCTDVEGVTRTALEALDDVFGFQHAILLLADEGSRELFAVAGHGYEASTAGAEVRFGAGVVGTAAERQRVICLSNVARSRVMRDAVHARGSETAALGATSGHTIALPALPEAASVAAVPLVVLGRLVGVLYLESDRAGTFGAEDEQLLRVVGGQLASILVSIAPEREEQGQPPSTPRRTPATGPRAVVTYYQADDSVFVGDDYVIKGVPGRILWKMLREHESYARMLFTNRELRLDESLGLPPGNDNLEARLLVLRRRLEAGDWPIALAHVARGRLELRVTGSIELVEVQTGGPFRAGEQQIRNS
jgi:putative methionine-R-sulfoxide reductase with GAF domain